MTIVKPNWRAVEMMIRSAGSFGGEPGRKDESSKTLTDSSVNSTPGWSNIRSNQGLTANAADKRPRANNMPISQVDIGEIKTPSAALMAAFEDSLSRSPLAAQITAQVSNKSLVVTATSIRLGHSRKDQPAR